MPNSRKITATIEPGWITKEEAMKLSGLTLKPFERWAARLEIPKQYVSVPGRRPVPTYREQEIKAAMQRPRAHLSASRVMNKLSDTLQQALETAQGKQQLALPAPEVKPVIPPDRKHLLTMKEAHELGWPLDLLRALKTQENPPGIRYGRRSFKYSADALRSLTESV